MHLFVTLFIIVTLHNSAKKMLQDRAILLKIMSTKKLRVHNYINDPGFLNVKNM